jgi:hypothetical protein
MLNYLKISLTSHRKMENTIDSSNYSQAHLWAYLNATLSVEETEAIDARIETDPQLAAALRALLNEKKHQELEKFQAAVIALPLSAMSLEAVLEPNTGGLVQNLAKWLKAKTSTILFVTSLTITMGIIIVAYNPFSQVSNAISVLTQPYLLPETLRDVDDQMDGIHKEARDLYLQQNYKAALEKFQIMIGEKHFENKEIKFYIAICHLKLNEPKAARTVLHSIDPKKDMYILYSVHWYMSLAYLKEPSKENIELARKLLQEIPQTHEYGSNAIDLSSQLDRILAK